MSAWRPEEAPSEWTAARVAPARFGHRRRFLRLGNRLGSRRLDVSCSAHGESARENAAPIARRDECAGREIGDDRDSARVSDCERENERAECEEYVDCKYLREREGQCACLRVSEREKVNWANSVTIIYVAERKRFR